MKHRVGGRPGGRVAGWPAGRVDGGHVHKHALSGPNLQTCKIQTSWMPSWDRVWQYIKNLNCFESLQQKLQKLQGENEHTPLSSLIPPDLNYTLHIEKNTHLLKI